MTLPEVVMVGKKIMARSMLVVFFGLSLFQPHTSWGQNREGLGRKPNG
jgi:hypothetical protein